MQTSPAVEQSKIIR